MVAMQELLEACDKFFTPLGLKWLPAPKDPTRPDCVDVDIYHFNTHEDGKPVRSSQLHNSITINDSEGMEAFEAKAQECVRQILDHYRKSINKYAETGTEPKWIADLSSELKKAG